MLAKAHLSGFHVTILFQPSDLCPLLFSIRLMFIETSAPHHLRPAISSPNSCDSIPSSLQLPSEHTQPASAHLRPAALPAIRLPMLTKMVPCVSLPSDPSPLRVLRLALQCQVDEGFQMSVLRWLILWSILQFNCAFLVINPPVLICVPSYLCPR